MWTFKAEGGLACVKGERYVHYSPEELRQAILDPVVQMKCDSILKETKPVAQLEMDTMVTYQKFKTPTVLVADRDICAFHQTVIDPKTNKMFLVAFSGEHPLCPPVKKVVRAQLHIGGFILTP